MPLRYRFKTLFIKLPQSQLNCDDLKTTSVDTTDQGKINDKVSSKDKLKTEKTKKEIEPSKNQRLAAIKYVKSNR